MREELKSSGTIHYEDTRALFYKFCNLDHEGSVKWHPYHLELEFDKHPGVIWKISKSDENEWAVSESDAVNYSYKNYFYERDDVYFHVVSRVSEIIMENALG